MTESGIQSLQVVLCDEIFAGRISVRLEPFVQFNATVDAGLSELVAKWQRPLPLIAQRGPGKRTRNRKPK